MSRELQEGFEVEWCYELPIDKHGDADVDMAKRSVKDFATRGEAVKFAKEMLKIDKFGCVLITPFKTVRDPDENYLLIRSYGESEGINQ